MAAQRDEPLGLGPVPAVQHPDNGGLEVVVADPAEHRAEVLEGQHVTFQERFLRLVANATWNARPEHDSRSTNIHSLIIIPATRRRTRRSHLGLRTQKMRLRNDDLHPVQAELGASAGHVPRHRHLDNARAVLDDQPLKISQVRARARHTACRATSLPPEAAQRHYLPRQGCAGTRYGLPRWRLS